MKELKKGENFDPKRTVMDEVTATRQAAAAQWGGPGHDDSVNRPLDWIKYVEMQCDKAIAETAGHVMNSKPMHDDIRARLLKIAGLALDGIDSLDRVRWGTMSPALGAPYGVGEQRDPDWGYIRAGMISPDKIAPTPDDVADLMASPRLAGSPWPTFNYLPIVAALVERIGRDIENMGEPVSVTIRHKDLEDIGRSEVEVVVNDEKGYVVTVRPR